MQVTGLDHVNIRTSDLDASAAFYADVLGLRVGPPPSVAMDRGRWLHDAGDRAIIHLRRWDDDAGSTGAVDHVALACTCRAEVVARLEARGAEFTMQEFNGVTLVLTRDPHGLMLELNFRD